MGGQASALGLAAAVATGVSKRQVASLRAQQQSLGAAAGAESNARLPGRTLHGTAPSLLTLHRVQAQPRHTHPHTHIQLHCADRGRAGNWGGI